MLSKAAAEVDVPTVATREKKQQYRGIEHAFETDMADCKKRMSEILCMNIRGTRIVRGALTRYSIASSMRPPKVCDVTDWSAGLRAADRNGNSTSAGCDGGCLADVGSVGVDTCYGLKYFTGKAVIFPDSFGMA